MRRLALRVLFLVAPAAGVVYAADHPPERATPRPAAAQSAGSASTRRLATIESLRQFPGYYHLQNVLLRGEFTESDARIVLRADEREIRVVLADDVRTTTGEVEARGQFFDVGRLEPGDPRVSSVTEGRDTERWPRPGEELFVRISSVTGAQPAPAPTVRAISLEPWRYDGRQVTLTGNFRGRNLFGDLPDSPGKSRYDFVLRGAEGALWVTGLRPRGRGFDLDVNRRVDTDRWVEVTGKVVHEQGLVRIEATQIAAAKQPAAVQAAEEPAAPPAPLEPVQVVFSSPSEAEIEVVPSAPVRIQFSRGLDEASMTGRVRVGYVGAKPSDQQPQFAVTYDGGSRAIIVRFTAPLERFRTVRVEITDGVKGFDGAPVTPWTLTFTVGG